jgi:hypothetical protein
MSAPTRALIPRRGAITERKKKRRMRQRTPPGHSQIEVGNSDSIPIPFEGLTLHESIPHPKDDELYVQSMIFQSNSCSTRNESIRRNRSLIRSRTKQSVVVRNTTVSSGHPTSRVSESSCGNEHSSGDEVGLNPSVFRIEEVVAPAIMSEGGTSISDGSESRKVLVIEKEGEAQTQLVGDSSLFRCPFWNALVDGGLFSNSEIALGMVHVHVCIAQSTGIQCG